MSCFSSLSIGTSPTLDSFSFIGGDFQELEFTVIDNETMLPVDLSYFLDIRWILFRLGDWENPILNLSGEILASDTSKFVIYINSEYTKNLSGLFVQQPMLIDSSEKEFRPAQGTINIIPRGNNLNSEIIETYSRIGGN